MENGRRDLGGDSEPRIKRLENTGWLDHHVNCDFEHLEKEEM